ncbi:chorismate--pyruvate lyase family protein [Sphaerotilaceae bacterium SBD11-9]
MSVERRLFPREPQYAGLLRMLIALDGSTTRVCEALAQAPMQIQLLRQEQTDEVPDDVREQLGGESWLVRVTAMHAHGQVMMDNLSFTRLDAVPGWFLDQLKEGTAPIGHLLQHLFVRRETVPASPRVEALLWKHVGLPDARASRGYRIVTEKKPLMMIFEAFRGGMVGEE